MRIPIGLLFFLLLPALFFSQTKEEKKQQKTLKKATKLYSKKKYEKVVPLLEDLQGSGLDNPNLDIMLGESKRILADDIKLASTTGKKVRKKEQKKAELLDGGEKEGKGKKGKKEKKNSGKGKEKKDNNGDPDVAGARKLTIPLNPYKAKDLNFKVGGLKKAIKKYEGMAFQEAIPLLEELFEKDPEYPDVVRMLADCYRHINNMEEAEKWYDRALTFTETTPQEQLNYALVLMANQKYVEAKTYLVNFLDDNPDDFRATNLRKACDIQSEIMGLGRVSTVHNLDINTEGPDFGPSFWGSDKVIFASNRNNKKKIHKWHGQSFLDFFVADYDGTMVLQDPKVLSGKVNSKFHEAITSVDSANGTIYFTRNNFSKNKRRMDNNRVIRLKLYQAKLKGFGKDSKKEGKGKKDKKKKKKSDPSDDSAPVDNSVEDDSPKKKKKKEKKPKKEKKKKKKKGEAEDVGEPEDSSSKKEIEESPEKWIKVREMKFNSDQYSVGHPSITEDGERLYFIMDKDGGIGQTDLYYADKEGDGWGTPQNLGKGINTEGKEMFPWIGPDNILYFASNGHEGLGGLDIFKVDMNDSEPVVVNMGYPVNSFRDDFALIVDLENNLGFFSSNRDGGVGDDDIYSFILMEDLKGIVVDAETDEPIEGAEITLIDESTQEKISKSLEDGDFGQLLALDQNISFIGVKEGYLTKEVSISTHKVGNNYPEIIVKMEKEKEEEEVRKGECQLSLNVVYGHWKKPAPNAIIHVLKTSTNEISGEKITTSEDGHLVYPLEANESYKIIVESPGKLPVQRTLSTTERTEDGKCIFEENIRIRDFNVGDVFFIIYYNFDKSDIRSDASIELNEVAEIMKQFPDMVVKMHSHTDSRGSIYYNEKLSERRAIEAFKYLTNMGISSSRLRYQFYGESQHVNNCIDGTECSEEAHQLNRRTEFELVAKYGYD